MELVFLYLLAIESICFCCGIIIVLQCSKKLANYLNTFHPAFIVENLTAPYRAGDWSVVIQQIRAIKNAYFGTMPDNESDRLRRRMQFYVVLSLSLMGLFIGTLIVSALILIPKRG